MGPDIDVVTAAADYAAIKRLFASYKEAAENYAASAGISARFDDMAAELTQLATFYADPGFLQLARHDGEPVGCVGVRALTARTGEIRRLFVDPDHRSLNTGSRLLDAAASHAQSRGIRRLVLSTLPSMASAHHLYENKGYVPIESYDAAATDGVEFLGRSL